MNATVKDTKHLFGMLSLVFFASLGVALYYRQYAVLAIPFAVLLFYFGWQSISIIFLLLIASLPFSSEVQVSDTLGTDLPDELLMLLTAVLSCFYALPYTRRFTGRNILFPPLVIVLLATLAWSVVSTVFSTQPLLSLKFLLAKSWYLCAFFVVPLALFTEKKTIRATALLLSAGMFIVTLVTLVRHSAYGFSFAHINDALHPFFRNHVNYAAMLVCLLPVSFAIWRHARGRTWKIMGVMALLILVAALGLSYSRGAWLALLTGSFAAWLLRRQWLLKSYILLVFVFLIGILWLRNNDRYLAYAHDYRTTIFHEDFGEHLVATYRLKDMSTAERFYRWIAGVRMIKDHPLVGFGPNSFYYNYKPYAVPAFKTWVSDNKEHSTVHNYFLLVTIEQGIPALLLLLLLAGITLATAQYLYHRSTNRFDKTVAMTCGSLFVMILTLNFLSDLVETDKIGSLFFLCLATLVSLDIKQRKDAAQ